MTRTRSRGPSGVVRALLTSLLFGVLVIATALAGAVPASAGGPDALRVPRSVAATVGPAVAPRGLLARPVSGRSTTASPAAEHLLVSRPIVTAGSGAPARTVAQPASDTVALLPDPRGPPALDAGELVVPASSSTPAGRTPATARSRAPPVSA